MKDLLRRPSFVMTALVSAVCAGFVFVVYLPTQHQMDTLRVERDEKSAFIAQSLTNAALFRQVQQEIDECRQHTAAWRAQGAGSAETAAIFGQVADAANRSGVVTLQFTPDQRQHLAQMDRIPLRLVGRGDFGQVWRMLAALEALPYSLWIDDLVVSGGEGKDAPLEFEANLVIFVGNSGNSG